MKNKYEKVGEITCIYRRGATWWVSYQHHGQHRQSLKTASKKEARTRALRLEREILTGHFRADRRPPLIEEVTAAFREAKVGEGLAKSTLKKYDYCIKLMLELAADLKISRISQITPSFMEKFRIRRTAKLAKRPGRDGQNTASKDLVTISEIVDYAIKHKLIQEDPLAGYAVKKVKPKPQPYWVQEESDLILATATRQPHKDVFNFLRSTGARAAEAQYLTWNDVDFDNGVIEIQAKAEWKPKTGDIRSIPMMDEVRSLLARQPKRCKWVFTFPAWRQYPDRQIRQRRLLDYLKRILKKLELLGHLHTFRHTFISLALTRGVPEATVRAWVGHVDADTIRRYTHIASQESQAAMRRLEESVQGRRASAEVTRS